MAALGVVVTAVAIPLVYAGGGSPPTTPVFPLSAVSTSGPSVSSAPASTSTSAASSSTAPSSADSLTVTSASDTTVLAETMTAERARQIGANELGRIPVLMYHLVGTGKNYLTPDQLHFHIALLRTHGFYPTTVREMVEGTMEIPPGKSPVVLTFDDSSPGQYRILDDGTLDPDSAVGILQDEVAWGSWAPKATFFPLLEANYGNVLFGQPDLAQTKLRNLVAWGYEIGSHGLTHMDFSKATSSQVRKELCDSQARLEALIGGGYEVFTISPPYGEYPKDPSLLLSGDYEGRTYAYKAVVMAWGESSPSPFSTEFDVVRIPRITSAAPESVKKLLKYWKEHRHLLYISDGDTETISFPEGVPVELGTLRANLAQRIVEY